MKLEPRPENNCYGCGGANTRGMKLVFEQDDARKRIVGRFTMGLSYEGAGGFLHGGVIAVLFDEAMGKVNRFRGAHAVTAQLSVDYLKPIRCDQEIVIEAWETDAKGRNLFHESEIRDQAGQLLARSKGRFVMIGERQPHDAQKEDPQKELEAVRDPK
jgi:uncharacterized protein (TIGR00369 family)